MPTIRELTGQVFGRWTVLGLARIDPNDHHAYWWCCCTCGTRRDVRSDALLYQRSHSCGCASDKPRSRPSIKQRVSAAEAASHELQELIGGWGLRPKAVT